MTAAFDASVLLYVVSKNAPAPRDPKTGVPVDMCAERLQHLLKELERQGERIVIPTPALAEVLVGAEPAAAAEYLAVLDKSRHFSIADFDQLAAVEFAEMQRLRKADPRVPRAAVRAKAKFDDQIVAISKVRRAGVVYSDDPDVQKLAQYFGLRAVGIAALPLAPGDAQGSLFDEPHG